MLLLYGLAISALVVLCTAECPNGFVKHGPSCYKVIRIEATFADAEIYCRAVDTSLLAINTADEQRFIEGYLQQAADSYNPKEFWVGATDIQEEQTWKWVKTGQDFLDTGVYTNWASGQPDNGDHHQENCLKIEAKDHFQWHDDQCDSNLFFICEKPAYSNGGMVIG